MSKEDDQLNQPSLPLRIDSTGKAWMKDSTSS